MNQHGKPYGAPTLLHKRKLSVFEIMKICGHATLEMLTRYSNMRGGDLVDRME